MLTTSFKLLHDAGACTGRYQHLAKALGGINAYGEDTPIQLARILETNGIDDALWALRAVPAKQVADRDRLARLYACDCAERVLPLFEAKCPDDKRPREAIAVARRYAHGGATEDDLAAAWGAAWGAALGAARSAAWDAALDAARSAAWDAALGAAWDAALDAARSAAWDAERAWQAERLAWYLKGGE